MSWYEQIKVIYIYVILLLQWCGTSLRYLRFAHFWQSTVVSSSFITLCQRWRCLSDIRSHRSSHNWSQRNAQWRCDWCHGVGVLYDESPCDWLKSCVQPFAKMEGFLNMLKIQWNCLFVEITNPGIPWTGMQCRSKRAGATGAFYALAYFVAPAPDKYLWILQGFSS